MTKHVGPTLEYLSLREQLNDNQQRKGSWGVIFPAKLITQHTPQQNNQIVKSHKRGLNYR